MTRQSRRIQYMIFAAAVTSLTACDFFTNPDPQTGTIRGTVTIDGSPAPNVEVSILRESEDAIRVRTDANGAFEAEVPTGAPIIRVTDVPDDSPFTVYDCLNQDVQVEVREGQTASAAIKCFDVTPYTLTATGSFDHNTGVPGESVECKRIATLPARPGATYSMTVDGPVDRTPAGGGVVPGQTFAGTLDANGFALVKVRITRLGTYRNTITTTSKGGVARGLDVDVNVTTGSSLTPC